MAGNPNAIGCASLSAVEGKDTVKAVTVGGVACTEETVLDGSYAIQRPSCWRPKPASPSLPRHKRSSKEFELLRLFLSHPGMAFTREQLFTQVWNMDYMDDSRTLDMHIRTLRQKLGAYGKLIETVRNVGYRMEAGL